MKKTIHLIFIGLCLLACLIPSIGMLFRPTTETIGNERALERPRLKEETFNVNYISDMGGWFEKHFAFRPELITADAKIQADLFRTSNLDTVVVGTDDWLYYASSVDDYLGRNRMSDRQIRGLLHNLEIIRDYAGSHGVDFLFTVAPNKNTLYGDHMPYYLQEGKAAVHNSDRLQQAIQGTDIAYCDLFELFRSRDEVLYFKRDSHWNNQGALLAYNALLDSIGKEHDDYASVMTEKKKNFKGDLSKMLYPASYDPEYNINYGAEERYTYVTETASVEDALIRTHCEDAEGSLYMYRDSFGNALLPFFAAAYQEAAFTKAFTADLEDSFQQYAPDVFIMELVERNLNWLLTMPPLLPMPEAAEDDLVPAEGAAVSVQPSAYSAKYLEVKGAANAGGPCYIEVTDGNASTFYECYQYSDAETPDGFLAYLKAEDYNEETMKIAVWTKADGSEESK